MRRAGRRFRPCRSTRKRALHDDDAAAFDRWDGLDDGAGLGPGRLVVVEFLV